MNRVEQRENLNENSIIQILDRLGSSPHMRLGKALVFDTVCHNIECGSKKLYYYPDSHLFRCYTECSETFDVFSLIIKHYSHMGIRMSVSEAIDWAVKETGVFFADRQKEKPFQWSKPEEQNKQLEVYDHSIIDRLPFYVIYDWQKEGIDRLSLMRYNIRVNTVSSTVVIPHYNIDGNLIGIRQRILAEEDAHLGKYRPAYINGKSYPHPLSYNLYGIHLNKDNIRVAKKAIIFEGEKGALYLDKFENSIAVSCCGSNISSQQIDILLSLGVEEIIVAFDKEFVEEGDALFEKQIEHLTRIYNKYQEKIYISFIIDLYNKLDYKDSPLDKGDDVFEFLYNNRVYLGAIR